MKTLVYVARLYVKMVRDMSTWRRVGFILSQLILFTAVPLLTVGSMYGGTLKTVASVYLAILIVLSYLWFCKISKDISSSELATKTARRLKEDSLYGRGGKDI